MIDDRQQELAALYALDLLDGAESLAFEAELKTNVEIQTLVRELRESSASFALSAPQVSPPPHLKAKILAKLDAQASAAPEPKASNVVQFRPAMIIPWAIAAGLAVGCFWIGQRYVATRADVAVLQEQQSLAEIAAASARNQLEAERIIANRQLADATQELAQLNQQVVKSTEQIALASRTLGETFQQLDAAKADALNHQKLLADAKERLAAATAQIATLDDRLQREGNLAQFKIATLAAMAGNSSQALAVAVWNPRTQEGILRVEKLAALASDKDYQLWLIDPAYPAPVDGGVFTVDPTTGHAQVNFKPNQRVNNAAKFAISLERKGGVPKAEGPIVLIGD
ncbi:MAG: anti-sigma factor [Opitutus sp.]